MPGGIMPGAIGIIICWWGGRGGWGRRLGGSNAFRAKQSTQRLGQAEKQAGRRQQPHPQSPPPPPARLACGCIIMGRLPGEPPMAPGGNIIMPGCIPCIPGIMPGCGGGRAGSSYQYAWLQASTLPAEGA